MYLYKVVYGYFGGGTLQTLLVDWVCGLFGIEIYFCFRFRCSTQVFYQTIYS